MFDSDNTELLPKLISKNIADSTDNIPDPILSTSNNPEIRMIDVSSKYNFRMTLTFYYTTYYW